MNIFKAAAQVMSATADFIYSNGDSVFAVDHNGACILRIMHVSCAPGRALISEVGAFQPHLWFPPFGKRPADMVFVGKLYVTEALRITREIYYEFLTVSVSPDKLRFRAVSQNADIEYEYANSSAPNLEISLTVPAKFIKVLHYICIHTSAPHVNIYVKNGVLLFETEGVELEIRA